LCKWGAPTTSDASLPPKCGIDKWHLERKNIYVTHQFKTTYNEYGQWLLLNFTPSEHRKLRKVVRMNYPEAHMLKSVTVRESIERKKTCTTVCI